MKLLFELHFRKKSDFVEKDFFEVIEKNINALGKEMTISSIAYQNIEEGYLFVIEYQPVLAGLAYQSVLGCFSGLHIEYPHIENIGIPMDKMKMIQ